MEKEYKLLEFSDEYLTWTYPDSYEHSGLQRNRQKYNGISFSRCVIGPRTFKPVVFYYLRHIPHLAFLAICDVFVSKPQFVQLISALTTFFPQLRGLAIREMSIDETISAALSKFVATSKRIEELLLIDISPECDSKYLCATIYHGVMRAKRLVSFALLFLGGEPDFSRNFKYSTIIDMARYTFRSLVTLTTLSLGNVYETESPGFQRFWSEYVAHSTALLVLVISKSIYTVDDKLVVFAALAANKHLQSLNMSSPPDLMTQCIIDTGYDKYVESALENMFTANTSLLRFKMREVAMIDGHSLWVSAQIWQRCSKGCIIDIDVSARVAEDDATFVHVITEDDDDHFVYTDALRIFDANRKKKEMSVRNAPALSLADSQKADTYYTLWEMCVARYDTEHLHLSEIAFTGGQFPIEPIMNLRKLRSLSICNTNLSTFLVETKKPRVHKVATEGMWGE